MRSQNQSALTIWLSPEHRGQYVEDYNQNGVTYGRGCEAGVCSEHHAVTSLPADLSNVTSTDFENLARSIRSIGMRNRGDKWGDKFGLDICAAR